MPSKKCPNCNHKHNAPFSEKVLDVVKLLAGDLSPEGRDELMLSLADIFTSEREATDICMPDEIHGLVEDYERASSEVVYTGLRLSRILLRAASSYLDNNQEDDSGNMPPKRGTKRSGVKKADSLN